MKSIIKNIEEYMQSLGITKVEYIKSTRNQIIDTGYIPGLNPKIVIEIKFDGDFNNTGNIAFLGVKDNQSYYMNFGRRSKPKKQYLSMV